MRTPRSPGLRLAGKCLGFPVPCGHGHLLRASPEHAVTDLDVFASDSSAAPGSPSVPVLAPVSLDEAAAMLAAMTSRREPVLLWGGGTHQGIGGRVSPAVVVATSRLDRIVAWEPEDLTVVVEAGMRVGDLDELLAEKGQSAVLPETAPEATVGGVVAAGISGYRRARYGPTRDRVLEVTLVTGDGRIVTGGGQVVKNVSGYDLPRLATGSLGGLGLVGRVCLKLWPVPPLRFTISGVDPAEVRRSLYRAVAVLETPAGVSAYVEGRATLALSRIGGDAVEGFSWPEPPRGAVRWSVRVPPARTAAVVERLDPGWDFVAQHGVGEVTVAADDPDAGALADLRGWAEGGGGSLVLLDAPDGALPGFDPWGSPPPGLELHGRLREAFDPARVLNPGRLPGGL